MKTLRVTLADIEGAAHASTAAGTSVTVSVAYSGQVVLTSGTVIPGMGKSKSLGSSGVVDFSVYASDDPAVQPEYRGFAVVVTATVRGPVGSPKTKLVRTVKPLESMSSTIQLGSLAEAQGLPPQWATVDEVLSDFTDRIDGLEGEVSGTANNDGTLIPFGPGEAYSNGDVTALAYNGAASALAGLDALTPGGIGAAPASHTHTPGEVGAYPALGSTYTGHINDLRDPGTYRISSGSMTSSNGYPWTPENVGYVIVHKAQSSNFVTQEVISETGTVWRRVTTAGTTTWRDWVPVAVDTGWRSIPLENGWAGNLYLRWRNGFATYMVTGLNGSAATNANVVSNVGGSTAFYAGAGRPAYGFGATSSPTAPPGGSSIGSIGMTGGTNNSILRASNPPSAWTNGAASVTFAPMSNALPSTLPGTPA